MALSDFRAKFNKSTSEEQFSMVKIKLSNSRFSRRSCVCGGNIQVHGDGRAVCDNSQCSTVFNDGGNTEGLLKITRKYDQGPEEVVIKTKWAPRKGEHGHSHLNKFIGQCKA